MGGFQTLSDANRAVVSLIEPEESEVLDNMLVRSRAISNRTEEQLRNEARAKWLHGQWLFREAA